MQKIQYISDQHNKITGVINSYFDLYEILLSIIKKSNIYQIDRGDIV